jgi:hypothetical protein
MPRSRSGAGSDTPDGWVAQITGSGIHAPPFWQHRQVPFVDARGMLCDVEVQVYFPCCWTPRPHDGTWWMLTSPRSNARRSLPIGLCGPGKIGNSRAHAWTNDIDERVHPLAQPLGSALPVIGIRQRPEDRRLSNSWPTVGVLGNRCGSTQLRCDRCEVLDEPVRSILPGTIAGGGQENADLVLALVSVNREPTAAIWGGHGDADITLPGGTRQGLLWIIEALAWSRLGGQRPNHHRELAPAQRCQTPKLKQSDYGADYRDAVPSLYQTWKMPSRENSI